MAKRGKKIERRKQTSRDYEDVRRLLRAAGSLDEYIRWGKEAWERLSASDFDDLVLRDLEFMDENWTYHRQAPMRGLTARQTRVRTFVQALWKPSLGQPKEAVVKRILDKYRARRRER
jgi:hypothetical protein